MERLLDGLERLEYRGYDSSGVCLLLDHGLESVRAVGKLSNLKLKIDGTGVGSTTGIGHTRWATHGRVTERNAHPLVSGNGHGDEVAIVLNGIIENHAALRAELIAEGHVFVSETDAEVVAHLLRSHYAGSLVDAIAASLGRLDGHFAFIAVHRDEPDLLAGTRRQCPLLVGIGDGETFLASSLTAFAGETRRVKLVDDDEIVAITPDEVRIATADGEVIDREDVVVAGEDDVADKDGWETFMLKEINEQPAAVGKTIAANTKSGGWPGVLDDARSGRDPAAGHRRLRHRLPRGTGRLLRDRGVGRYPVRDRGRERMALPPSADRGGHPRRRHLPVRGDGRHAGEPAPRPPPRGAHARDHELPRLPDHA